jgi:hypothetical protein
VVNVVGPWLLEASALAIGPNTAKNTTGTKINSLVNCKNFFTYTPVRNPF